jgi:hypothetical protein
MRTLLALTFAGAACGGPRVPGEPQKPENRTDLRRALSADDVDVVGVAFDRAPYVLDAKLGLYRIETDGTGTRIVDLETLSARAPLQESLTDLAAIGGGRFALTALNDGFVYDMESGAFEQHFCYEPGWIGDRFDPVPVVQSTHSVAVDAAGNRIYAQPQTLERDDRDEVLLSQVGVWDLETGTELEWYDVPDADFFAGGMMVERDHVVLLAEGDVIHRFDLLSGVMEPITQIDGVSEIRGLAQNAEGKLLVLDGIADEVVMVAAP